MINNEHDISETPAPNKRFSCAELASSVGVMRGVCSRKVLREFEPSCKEETRRVTSPSRQPLVASGENAVGRTRKLVESI